MDFLDALRTAEFRLGGLYVPWGFLVGTMGFLGAWAVVAFLERRGFTRHIWHLPLFFVALAVLLGCIAGLILAP